MWEAGDGRGNQGRSEDGAALIARAGRGATQGATRRFDIDLVKADGTTLPVRILHCLPRYGGNGGLAHALVLNRAPGGAEEAAAAELRFARLFNSAPIAIATVDREGTISTTNAAFVRLFGRFAGDLALTFRATGGVYAAGGVARRLGGFLDAPDFRAAFEQHPPYRDLLKTIPTLLITLDEPGLLGCAALAATLD